MAPLLDERSRRRWAASEARVIGHGGVSAVAEATGLARRTICRGLEDLEDRGSVGNDRIRRRGGGRKSRITEDPTLLADLKSLLEPVTRGDPMRRQLWTSLWRPILSDNGVFTATIQLFLLNSIARRQRTA